MYLIDFHVYMFAAGGSMAMGEGHLWPCDVDDTMVWSPHATPMTREEGLGGVGTKWEKLEMFKGMEKEGEFIETIMYHFIFQ